MLVLKTARFSLTTPPTVAVGDAIPFTMQEGIEGPATVIYWGSGGLRIRINFTESFKDAHYVVLGNGQAVVKNTEYLDLGVKDVAGDVSDVLIIG